MYNEQIIPLAQELGDVTELLNSRMDYAGVLFRLGNVNLARQEYEAVYELEEFLVDSRYRTALFNNLAITYLNSGSFDRYIEFQLEAYDIAVQENNLQYQLSILRNLHIFYRRNRNPELAFNYISEALSLASRNELRSEIPSILISMGVHTRESLGRYDQALEYLTEARQITEEMDRYLDNIQSLIEIARTYSRKDNFEMASSYFLQALSVSEQRDDVVRAASTAFRLADLYVEAGLYDEARELTSRYASVSPDMLSFNIAVTSQNVQHKLLLERGLIEEALESSRYLIAEITAWLRESADSQTGQMRLDPEFSEAYRIHHNLLYENGLYAELLAVNEQFRTISRSAFFNNPLLKSTILNEEELLLDFALGNRIQRLRRQLADAEGPERIQISNDLLNAVNRRSQLLDRISPFVPESQESFEISGVQRSLGRGEIILYFSIQNEQVFQTHITRRNIESVRHDDSARLYQLIRDAQLSFGPGTTDLNKLHEIYRIVFANLNPEDYRHIYIVPDGSFYQIPFEILPVAPPNSANSFGSTTFLLEKTSISYLNTANELLTKPQQRRTDFTYGYAGFGLSDFRTAGHQTLSNLPFAPQEIYRSASSLQQIQPALTFLNEESTRSRFYEVAGNSRILHLATHSVVEDEDPLFSALYLHQAIYEAGNGNQTTDDGIVRAYNLFDIDLSADLVVLSSCESAQGEYLAGSGILGLSRAFSYAGAQSLLMNLWPVKDQTASQITSRFFANLDTGSNKAESLRQARLDYLNNVNSDPFLWGGYVMHGNIAPVHSGTGFIKIAAVSLSIAGILILLQLARVKLRKNSSSQAA
ncbi:MAG: CHAT domain-containing protein [Balneolia bacterium]|nr:CHAT domain-containing protein [Balneolia bacterium]